VLVKFTAWLAGIFFIVTFVLSILYARKSAGESALRRELMKTQAAAPASPASSTAPDSGAGVLPAGSAIPIASPAASAPVAPPSSPAATAKPKPR
jgi:hypothetical protein